MSTVPPPGSRQAKAEGCRCPVLDNHYGRGLGDGKFWIAAHCPLHATPAFGMAPCQECRGVRTHKMDCTAGRTAPDPDPDPHPDGGDTP